MSAEHWTDRFQGQAEMYGELSDGDIATKVRMLGRNDLDHEPVVQAARDRIARLSRANRALTAENERLRQRLLTAAGDDLCRLTQEEIKDLTGGKVPIPPKGEFLASCELFHAQIAAESGVNQNCLTLAQLVAENERLTRELGEATKRLAELTKPADEEELAKAIAIGMNPGSRPWINFLSAYRECCVKIANELAALVRAPLLQQIADQHRRIDTLNAQVEVAEAALDKLAAAKGDMLTVAGESLSYAGELVDWVLGQVAELTEKLDRAARYRQAFEETAAEFEDDRDRVAAEQERDGWKRSFEAQNVEIRKLSDEMADNEDAIERLREIGKAIGCDHVGGPDERRQIVNCVEQTIEAAEQRADAAEARERSLTMFVAEVRRLTYYYVCSHAETFHGEAKKALAELDQALAGQNQERMSQ